MIPARVPRLLACALLGALLLSTPPRASLNAKEDEVADKKVAAARKAIATRLGELTRLAAKERDFTAAHALAATHRLLAADGQIEVASHHRAVTLSRSERWRSDPRRRRPQREEQDRSEQLALGLRSIEPHLATLEASRVKADRHQARLVRQLRHGVDALRILHDARGGVRQVPLAYDAAASLRAIAMLEALLEKGQRPATSPDTTPWYRHARPVEAARQFVWRHETRHDLLHPRAKGLVLATYGDAPFRPYVTLGVANAGSFDVPAPAPHARYNRRQVFWPGTRATDVPVTVDGPRLHGPSEPTAVTVHLYGQKRPPEEHLPGWRAEHRLWIRRQDVSKREPPVAVDWFSWEGRDGWVVGLRPKQPLARGVEYGGNWEFGPGTRNIAGSWRFTTAED